MSEVLKAVTGIAALALGKSSKEDGKHVDEQSIGLVSVKAQLDRRKIDGSEDYEGHLMVSITGSDKNFKRTPICTVLVLDVSGSMTGPKLDLLKETATKIAKNLTDKDEIAIVAFSSHVETVLERTNASKRETILAAIARLQTTGCTNMSGGFQQGLQQVNEKFKGVKRIMLLTDGMANEGISDRAGLLGIVKDRDSSCTLSTFGFGIDCDQELLADMAKAAGGNYYFISGNDIKNVFARELGGMLSCIGQNLEVRIKPNKGGEVLEVLNDFTVEDRNGEAAINAEDLYAGETKHVLVRFRVAKPEGKPKARPFSVAHILVSWDGVKTKKHEKLELNPKASFVKAKDADDEPVLEVAEQVALIDAANAQLKAVEAAEMGDFDGAQGLLRNASIMFSSLVARGSESAKGLVSTMGASAKGFRAGSYNTAFGSTVSNAASNATRYRKAGGTGNAFLSANVQGTQSMDMLEDAFTNDDDVDPMDLDDIDVVTTVPTADLDDLGVLGDNVTITPTNINWEVGNLGPVKPGTGKIGPDGKPFPIKPPIVTPGFPSPGQPNPRPKKPKLEPKDGVDESKSKFAKRSKRWNK